MVAVVQRGQRTTQADDDALREIGYSEEDIKKLREPDYLGRIGYPDSPVCRER